MARRSSRTCGAALRSAISNKCYQRRYCQHTRSYCATNLTPAQLEPALVDEAAAARKRKAATAAALGFNKKMNARGVVRVVAELQPARRASLAARVVSAESG